MHNPTIVIFGAGKIGRSFIGQLFGKAGFAIVFIDTDELLIREVNIQGSYPVIIKGADHVERIDVEKVRAVHASDRIALTEAICHADILAVSVGKTALAAIAPSVAKGIMEREKGSPGSVMDIILAENMRDAARFFREKLEAELPASYPIDLQVGLIETSIGKMVPIMTARDLEKEPLQIFAEPYNTLILDKKGFKGKIPEIEGLSLKENMKAWVDRKAFIHNLGHATAAYCGFLKQREAVYMYEVLADADVYRFTKEVMTESARILLAAYPDEFTFETLSYHIDDLLARFQNRNLGDTLFRVGSDLHRKLGHEDRFMGIIRLAIDYNMKYNLILEALVAGFKFKAVDENGRQFPDDVTFQAEMHSDPDPVLNDVCGIHATRDRSLYNQIKSVLKTDK